MRCRMEAAQNIKTSFCASLPLTIHWDGKLLPDITGHERVDRLPVIVSAGGKSQLLGVPSLSSGSGKNQAAAIYHLICEWNLVSKISAMCFDTTAVNTGELNLYFYRDYI